MKFDMSEAWRDAKAMISGNREVLLIVAGMFFFLPSLLLGFALGDVEQSMVRAADPEQVVLAVYAQWWWLFLLVVATTMVGYLALLALLRDTRRPTVGEAIAIGLKGLLPMVGVYILMSFTLGLLFTVLLGIAMASGSSAVSWLVNVVMVAVMLYVAVRLALVPPVIAIDKVFNPIKAIKRSWRLTRGNGARLLAFFLLIGIAYMVCAIVIGMVLSLLIVIAGEETGVILNAVITGLLGALVTILMVAIIASVHRQLGGSPAVAGESFE